jgi:hypothetical protein
MGRYSYDRRIHVETETENIYIVANFDGKGNFTEPSLADTYEEAVTTFEYYMDDDNVTDKELALSENKYTNRNGEEVGIYNVNITRTTQTPDDGGDREMEYVVKIPAKNIKKYYSEDDYCREF